MSIYVCMLGIVVIFPLFVCFRNLLCFEISVILRIFLKVISKRMYFQ